MSNELYLTDAVTSLNKFSEWKNTDSLSFGFLDQIDVSHGSAWGKIEMLGGQNSCRRLSEKIPFLAFSLF
jgi:hypothetical protein